MRLCWKTYLLRFRRMDRVRKRSHRHNSPSDWFLGKATVVFPPSCPIPSSLWAGCFGFLNWLIADSFVCKTYLCYKSKHRRCSHLFRFRLLGSVRCGVLHALSSVQGYETRDTASFFSCRHGTRLHRTTPS